MCSHRSPSLPFFQMLLVQLKNRVQVTAQAFRKAASTAPLPMNFDESGCGCHAGAHEYHSSDHDRFLLGFDWLSCFWAVWDSSVRETSSPHEDRHSDTAAQRWPSYKNQKCYLCRWVWGKEMEQLWWVLLMSLMQMLRYLGFSRQWYFRISCAGSTKGQLVVILHDRSYMVFQFRNP